MRRRSDLSGLFCPRPVSTAEEELRRRCHWTAKEIVVRSRQDNVWLGFDGYLCQCGKTFNIFPGVNVTCVCGASRWDIRHRENEFATWQILGSDGPCRWLMHDEYGNPFGCHSKVFMRPDFGPRAHTLATALMLAKAAFELAKKRYPPVGALYELPCEMTDSSLQHVYPKGTVVKVSAYWDINSSLSMYATMPVENSIHTHGVVFHMGVFDIPETLPTVGQGPFDRVHRRVKRCK